jgi:hypothetical protein
MFEVLGVASASEGRSLPIAQALSPRLGLMSLTRLPAGPVGAQETYGLWIF